MFLSLILDHATMRDTKNINRATATLIYLANIMNVMKIVKTWMLILSTKSIISDTAVVTRYMKTIFARKKTLKMMYIVNMVKANAKVNETNALLSKLRDRSSLTT